MTKKDIAKRMAVELGMTEVKARGVIQKTLDLIVTAIDDNGGIELRNFGIFKVKERSPRLARNPRTGEEVRVPGKRTVVFKPGKEMAQRILNAGRREAAAARISTPGTESSVGRPDAASHT